METRFTPFYPPVSLMPPKPDDLKNDSSLKEYMAINMKLETEEETERRKKVLQQIKDIFLNWVKTVAVEILHLPEEEATAAGGDLFISGSYKLGVKEPGADIDTVCVAPNFCTREHFFSILKDEISKHPAVTEFAAIETARVPQLAFDFEGISIDLLFAQMADSVIPRNIDILDDNILTGLDEAAEKSLNGPRVTLMISKLVGEETFQNFLIVLRCVRRWAKRRGLYGNKLGYLGGVNCNILVAFVCQLYPKASPSTLLEKFFLVYKGWKWPKPVMLNMIQPNPEDTGKQRIVWSAEENPWHIMPIITPAYPAMNSSDKVNEHTRMVMIQEISRGHDELRKIVRLRGPESTVDWDVLFEPSDFYVKYSHYLQCHIVGVGDDVESRSWIGFVESRLLGLTQELERDRLPLLKPIHLFPEYRKTEKSAKSICYFIGFNIDHEAAAKSDKHIHIDDSVLRFR